MWHDDAANALVNATGHTQRICSYVPNAVMIVSVLFLLSC